MDSADIERFAQAFGEFGRTLARVVEKMAKALKAICDWFIPLHAAEGIAALEMDLKLRSEVGLRTDLLALFDP